MLSCNSRLQSHARIHTSTITYAQSQFTHTNVHMRTLIVPRRRRHPAVLPATLRLTWRTLPSADAEPNDLTVTESLRLFCAEHGGQVDAVVLAPMKHRRSKPAKRTALVSFRSSFGAVFTLFAGSRSLRTEKVRVRPTRVLRRHAARQMGHADRTARVAHAAAPCAARCSGAALARRKGERCICTAVRQLRHGRCE